MLRRKTHRLPGAGAALLAGAAALVLAACSGGGAPGGTAGQATGSGTRPAGITAGGPSAASGPGTATPGTGTPGTGTPAAGKTPGTAASSPAADPGAAAPSATLADGARLVTFSNRVSEEVWVAASPDAGHPLAATGWALEPGQSVTIVVPNKWNGRFWGRTGCVFSGGTGHCQTGDCGGLFQCTGYGAIPATLAEYNLDAWDNLDFYDVSMVDGSNLPMYIYPTSGSAPNKVSPDGCVAAGCTTAVICPPALRITADGAVVACESACAKLGGDQYCCRGQWAPRAMCDPAKWPVDYAAVFKRAEPYAYSYVDDDATSVYTCSGTCDYHIVFGLTPAT